MNETLRRTVFDRSDWRCEYCLIPHDRPADRDPLLPGPHVDHVIAIKHGGGGEMENLATACFRCNGTKGTDLATLDEKGQLVRLFNPRTQSWTRHFQVAENGTIQGVTRTGRATTRLLTMNDEARITLRHELVKRGRLRIPTGRRS